MTKIGGYITTYSGKHFYPIDPDTSMFCLEDVARGLSHENRANGQTTLPFSVAQHSVNVSQVLEDLGYDVRTQFIGLTHDISEAFIKDIPSPLKEWLPDYVAIEKKVQDTAYEWAGLGEVTDEEYEIVNWADKAMFPVEAKSFMPNAVHPIDPLLKDMVIMPWTPEKAREEFIKLFVELKRQLCNQK